MMLGWAFAGGLFVQVLPLAAWLARKLTAVRAAGLGAALVGLYYGGLFIHVSPLAWLGDDRRLFAMGVLPGLLAGAVGLAATFAPGIPLLVRRLLFLAAGLLLLPLVPGLGIFAPGLLVVLVATGTFWVLAFLTGRTLRREVPTKGATG
jgi:hypothetical protein